MSDDSPPGSPPLPSRTNPQSRGTTHEDDVRADAEFIGNVYKNGDRRSSKWSAVNEHREVSKRTFDTRREAVEWLIIDYTERMKERAARMSARAASRQEAVAVVDGMARQAGVTTLDLLKARFDAEVREEHIETATDAGDLYSYINHPVMEAEAAASLTRDERNAWDDYTNTWLSEHDVCAMTAGRTLAALVVVALSTPTRLWLMTHDPKALEQVDTVLESSLPEELQHARSNVMDTAYVITEGDACGHCFAPLGPGPNPCGQCIEAEHILRVLEDKAITEP